MNTFNERPPTIDERIKSQGAPRPKDREVKDHEGSITINFGMLYEIMSDLPADSLSFKALSQEIEKEIKNHK